MLLQTAVTVATQAHPLSGTLAEWVWLLPLLPLAGFVINGLLALNGAHFGPTDPTAAGHDAHSESADEALAISHAEQPSEGGDDHHVVKRHRWAGVVSVVGPGVLILSFLLALGIWQAMATAHPDAPFIQRYFSWMPAGDLQIDAAIQLDQLSMVMVLVITGVGALIHVFSVGYMRDDPSYPRFFSYLNLFVFFMLVLVLGANYPVLFVGWEGVGLCSYLLIGFWFNDKQNADAGKKAFIVNRVGDFGFLVAMFMLFANIGVLDFIGVSAKAMDLGMGSVLVTTICLFMFLGSLHLAAGRDGWSYAGLSPDPCGDDGHGRRLSHRTQLVSLFAFAGRFADGCGGGSRDGDLRCDDRSQAVGYQEGSGLFDHLAARLHVHRGRGRRLCVGDVPPRHPRFFQGALVPRIRLGDPGHARGVSQHPQR